MMNNRLMEEYLYTLRMNDGALSFGALLNYTNSSKTMTDEAFFEILGTIGGLKNKGLITVSAAPGAEDESMILTLTELGVKVADEAAEERISQMMFDWTLLEGPPRIA